MDHSGAIKGMSIANTILSGIYLLVIVVCAFAILPNLPGLIDYAYNNATYGSGSGYGYGYNFDLDDYYGYGHHNGIDYYGVPSSEFVSSVTVGAISGILVLGGILCALMLVASILSLINAGKREKINIVFIWSIIGAVVAFFGFGIISAVLFIICAVFSYKDKKLYKPSYSGSGHVNPVYGTVSQPAYQVPANPNPQASVSAAPQASANPAPQVNVKPAPQVPTNPAPQVPANPAPQVPTNPAPKPAEAAERDNQSLPELIAVSESESIENPDAINESVIQIEEVADETMEDSAIDGEPDAK